MATKQKSLENFLNEQSKNYYAFVITPGTTVSDVDIYPYTEDRKVLLELRLSVPKNAIESVNLVGTTVELSGRRHEVVNIMFAGDIGLVYEQVFCDLIENKVSNVTQVTPTQETKDINIYKPLRDWCGWHWPSPRI